MKITRKGYADDELLQHPNLQSPHFLSTVKELADAGITTYSRLVETINDQNVDVDIRATACWTISNVYEALDKRYILKPLTQAAKSSHHKIQVSAVHSLSILNYKSATDFLVNRGCDKQENFDVRLLALQGLTRNQNLDYFLRLRAIIFDETDDIRSRSEALEWLNYPPKVNPVNDFIQLLQHPLPDLRFWAAYRLSLEHRNISKALNAIDEVAAFDHHLPATWGWHIDREALQALEGIYWRKLFPRSYYRSHPPMYLISPAPEYTTFEWRFRKYKEGDIYQTLPEPRITFRVEANWLAEKLQEKWPGVKLDIREPKPQTYLVNWLIRIGNRPLTGGLHRDQYTIVITGSSKAIQKFAAWYRSIIEAQQYLFLYEWADLAVALRAGMSAADVEAEQVERGKNMSALHEQTINYPWVVETE